MQIFKRLKKYKAKDPFETITWIRNILAECDIFLSETTRFTDAADVVSCRIWLSDDGINTGDFGTNGKGMNARYALASAYGEFMERLQNFQLFGDYSENAFHKGLTKYMAAPDEVMLDAEESIKEGREILEKLLRTDADKLKTSGTDKMPNVPYYDVFRDRQIMLPKKTVRMITGSNGMAAGNTYMEAVTQGLAEIYERAAVMEAYRDNPVIRQLHPESFAGNTIYDRLERMKRYGYNYKILDLSMGKGYPVVGLLLEINGVYAFRAGADPCPVTALERCLTEIFQGSAEEVRCNFHRDCCRPFPSADERIRREINEAEIAYHVDGSGKTADCLFHPSDSFTEDFPGTSAESEEADYRYITELTDDLGYSLYIRDCSFLEFPAYHIVVPELSNYDLLYENGADIFEWSFDRVEFRSDRCTEKCAEILNTLYKKYEENTPVQNSTMIR